jgi:hypothetical protein
MFLEMFLIFVQHPIKPGKQFLCTVISMQDNRDAVDRSNGTDIMRTSYCSSNTCLLLAIGDSLTWIESALSARRVYRQSKQLRLATFVG